MSDEMYHALRPMLAVGKGDLWLMSTPFLKRGFFYETWEFGGDRWFRVTAKATECPRIDKEFLEIQRGAMGAASFEQEYLCGFVDSGSGLFSQEALEKALDGTVEPLLFGSVFEK